WEEPDRIFEYSFSSKAKKFRYVFTAPKELNIKNRILETARDLGIKRRAEPPANIRYLKDHTEVIFETAKKCNIQAHDTFEFHW
ncbi:MAG: hypothetical protein ACE5RL_02980, partial [Nitrosarchaeum sp.]